MSTMTRDPRGFFGNPRLSRPRGAAGGESAGAGKWHWPDPEVVAPPDVARGQDQETRSWRGNADTLDALWPTDPPADSWPGFLGQPLGADELIEPEAPRPQPLRNAFAPDLAESYPLPEADPATRSSALPRAMDLAGTRAPSNPPMPFAASVGEGWPNMVSIPDEPAPRADPSPSRLAYRLNRLWLTPHFRRFVRFGLPVLLTVGCVAMWLSDAGRRADLWASVESLRTTVENQPMFQVSGLDVQSRSPEVAQGVAQLLPVSFPMSSFRLDYDALRAQVEALDVVERASVRVQNGVLLVRITERVPAMIWRGPTGLDLIDASGHRVARLVRRAARADLPLIAGSGAPDAIAEARALLDAARPLQARLRGLVRVGERRWDLVLDRNQRILLPELGALAALERVLALHAAQDLLARDVLGVDMRNPARPVLRLPEGAAEALSPITRP